MNRTVPASDRLEANDKFVPLEVEGFEQTSLSLKKPGWLKGPKLYRNGEPCRGSGWFSKEYTVRGDQGRERTVEFNPTAWSLVDPYPRIKVDDQTMEPVDRLSVVQYLWGGWPIALVFVGGLIGALFGVVTTRINIARFRHSSGLSSDLTTGLISLVSVGLCLLVSGLFQIGIESLLG